MKTHAFHFCSFSKMDLQSKGLKDRLGIAVGASYSERICGRAYALKLPKYCKFPLILTFAFLFKFVEILGVFLQMEKCAIFWEIKHLNVILFSTECILLCSAHIKCLFYFSLFIPAALKWTDPKNEQNRSSSLGPWHLNLMDNLKNVFTSRIFSRFHVTAVRTIFLDPLISWQN